MKSLLNINSIAAVLFAFILLVQPASAVGNATAQDDDGFGDLSSEVVASDTTTTTEEDWFSDFDETEISGTAEVVTPEKKRKTVYPLLEISIVTIVLYLITWLLSKTRYLKVSTHRKIWNMVLLIAFIVSGLLGLMLVVQINYDVLGSWYSSFMKLHVEFGIVMALISVFHIFWHTKYFLTMFKGKK